MCHTEFDMLRSYHVVDPPTIALILRSGIVLFLKSACCLWALLGVAALLIEFVGRRAWWLRRIRRVAGDTRLTVHRTGWRLRRILAPMLVALLLLSGAASGNDQVLGKPLPSAAPKSKCAALTYSLVGTFAPVVSGGGLVLYGAMQSDQNTGVVMVGAGVVALGLILGPGAGHAYAGNAARFWRGVLLRGIALPAGGALAVYHGTRVSSLKEFPMIGKIVVAVCGVTYLASTVNDIATVGRSVYKYNHSRGLANVRVQPLYFAATRAVGFKVSMKF